MSYNLETNSWKNLTTFAGQPELSEKEIKALYRSTHAASANGLLFTGVNASGSTDTVLLDLVNSTWENLGNFGLNTSGFIGCSAAVVGSTAYLTGSMANQGDNEGDGMSLYVFPEGTIGTGGGLARTVSAQAGTGGSATVETWRGAAGTQANASLNDTATWKAAPAQGYAFEGWFTEDGEKVSTSATYSMPVNGDIALTARFTAASNPNPSDPESGGQEQASNDTNGKSPSAKTGDGAAPFVAGAVALFAASAAALTVAVRRLKKF